jgi:hypothetical protein
MRAAAGTIGVRGLHRPVRFYRRATLVLVGLVAVLSLVGCSSEQPAKGSPSSDGSVSLDPGPTTLASGSEALSAGTYELDLDARGSGNERFPHITITVPDGWANIDGWALNSGEGTDHWVGVTFWDVDEVFAHPCQWQGRRIQPGPTVADLAKALAKQPLRDATEPVDIVVDGFQGMQLEWSVPAGIDFTTCDQDESEGDHLFRSWTAARDSWASDRYQQGPGQVDRLWILDIDGERLVVDAMYMPSTEANDREELWQVMESIRFET